MGNDFSRKPLLPVFSHLDGTSIEEVEERYKRYKKRFRSEPFLTRVQYSKLFFEDDDLDEDDRVGDEEEETDASRGARQERERIEAFLMNRRKTDPVADTQYAYLDRWKRQKISALDIFAGLGLTCHESMDGRVKFAFTLVDFGRLRKINHAELTLLISAALRGIARFKGIRDAQMWESDAIARRMFVQSGVHLRAGEGVGDYAEGGVTVEQIIKFCRKDVKARALLDNIDSGAYLSGLLKQQQDFFSTLIDIEGAIAMKSAREGVHKSLQALAQNTIKLFLLTDSGDGLEMAKEETKASAEQESSKDGAPPPLALENSNGDALVLREAGEENDGIQDESEDVDLAPPGSHATAMKMALKSFKSFGQYSPGIVTALVHHRLFLQKEEDAKRAALGEEEEGGHNDQLPRIDEEYSASEGDRESEAGALVVREEGETAFSNGEEEESRRRAQERPRPEKLGVWEMVIAEDGKKKFQHSVTGEFVPEVPLPPDERDAEAMLAEQANTYIQMYLSKQVREELHGYLDDQQNTWWVSADNFHDAAFAGGIMLPRLQSELILRQLTSSEPPENLPFNVPGIVAENLEEDEASDGEPCAPIAETSTPGSPKESPSAPVETTVAVEAGRSGEEEEEYEESEDEDEDSKVYYGQFESWLIKCEMARQQLEQAHAHEKNRSVMKRQQLRDQMMQRRAARRYLKFIQNAEAARLAAEAEEARRLKEAEDEGGDDEGGDDEDANLSFQERALKRAHKRWSKRRRHGETFVLTKRNQDALNDMLSGYNVQGALDLAEKRRNTAAIDLLKSKDIMNEFEQMLSQHRRPANARDTKGRRRWKKKKKSKAEEEEAEGEAASDQGEAERGVQDVEQEEKLDEIGPPVERGGLMAKLQGGDGSKEPWEEDTDNENDDSIIAKELDFRHPIPLSHRGMWLQMELRRRSIAGLHWSRDLSDAVKWKRRFQRLARGWEEYRTEYDSELSTRHMEDEQQDIDCGKRMWCLDMNIDGPYRTLSVQGYTKKDIDDSDDEEGEEEGGAAEEKSEAGDNLEGLSEKEKRKREKEMAEEAEFLKYMEDFEDSESDEEDLPVPLPRPKVAVELEVNRGNPSAAEVLEALESQLAQNGESAPDPAAELWTMVREQKQKTQFSIRALLLRKYCALPIGKSPVPNGARATSTFKHPDSYSSNLEHIDREDELDESDMIGERRAAFCVEFKTNKDTRNQKDVDLIADSFQALFEIPIIARAFSAFMHTPRVERVISFGEECIRMSFLLYPDADPFIIFARMAGQSVEELFSEVLPTGSTSHMNTKTKGGDGGGITLVSTRAEINVDVGEAFDLTLPFVDHHTNTVKWVPSADGSGSFVRGLTNLAKRCVNAIFKKFDADKDGGLSYGEINVLNKAVRVPLFPTPKEYTDAIAEDKFDACKAGVGIGLTAKGLKEAYALGEGDLARDMANLHIGSLSHFFKAKIYANVECSESFGRRLMEPVGVPLFPGRGNSPIAKWFASLFRYVRQNKLKMRGSGLMATLKKFFNIRATVRDDGSPMNSANLCNMLCWLLGHPGAFAQQIMMIRRTFQTDVEDMQKFIERAQAEGWEDEMNAPSPEDHYNLHGETPKQKSMEEMEAEAERQDCLDASRIIVRLHELMKKNIDELTSVCFISDNLSIRANISGLDIVRVLYDLPAKIQPPTPQEVKYAKKKEDKKRRKEHNRAARRTMWEKSRKGKKKKNLVSFADS